jgi:branched-chain amino acid transport system ATP-binding protein
VSAPLLEVRDLHVAYGLSRVLFGVSLNIFQGQCVSLLGRNGVGKTTTMRAIMGLTAPSAGTVLWKGTSIAGAPPYRTARAGIGFVPEDRRVFGDLTVRENLDVACRKTKTAGNRWSAETVFRLFPKLRELSGRRAGVLSGGEQQMLTIGRTLMGDPELLLLDEPSEGLAPLVVADLQQQIGRLRSEGLTILLAEQNVAFSLALADHVYVLEKGTVKYSGAADELRFNHDLRHKLLAL